MNKINIVFCLCAVAVLSVSPGLAQQSSDEIDANKTPRTNDTTSGIAATNSSVDQSILEELEISGRSFLEDEPKSALSAGILKGAVQHNEQVGAVGKDFRVGAVISEARLEGRKSNNHWHKIPPWMAGVWEFTEQTLWADHKSRNSVPVKSIIHRIERIGYQQDASEQVWDFDDRLNRTESALVTDIDFNRNIEVLALDESKIVYRLTATRCLVSKQNRHITKTVQLEAITMAFRNGDKGAVFSQSQRVFNEDGEQISTSRIVAKATKRAPYLALETLNGQQLPPLFKEFLIQQGLGNLAP